MDLVLLRSRGKPTLDLSFMGALPSVVTFLRASSGTRINSAGECEWISSDLPRFDYDPVTLQLRGLLIEEQRQNLLYNSTITAPLNTGTQWYAVNTALGQSQTVLGSVVLSEVLDDTTNALHNMYLNNNTVVAGDYYTTSCYAKKSAHSVFQLSLGSGGFGAESYASFDLDSGTVRKTGTNASSRIENWGNGLFRCMVTAPATTSASSAMGSVFLCNNDGTVARGYAYSGSGSGVYVGGFQTEKGRYATSLIPTAGSPVTRAADSVTLYGIPWLRYAQGAVLVKAIPRYVGAGIEMDWSCFSDGTYANVFTLLQTPVGGMQHSIRNASSGNTTPTAYNITQNAVNKMAVSWDETTNSVSVNGSAVASAGITVGIPSAVNRLGLGRRGDDANRANGWLQGFAYWNKTLDSETLRKASS